MAVDDSLMCSFSILKAADTKNLGRGLNENGLRPKTPPSKTNKWVITNTLKSKFIISLSDLILHFNFLLIQI
jgi:hypothetical protein